MTVLSAGKYSHGYHEDEKPGIIPFVREFCLRRSCRRPMDFHDQVDWNQRPPRYSYRDWVENTPAVVHSQTYSAYPYTIRETGKHFLERVIGHGEEPLSTLDDAITCMKMIEACELSVSEDRHIRIDS